MEFKQILRGGIITLGSKVSIVLSGLGINYFISHAYGAETLGTISLLTNVLNIFALIGMAGFNMLILKNAPSQLRISTGAARELFRRSMIITSVFSIVLAIILACFARTIADEVFTKPYLSMYLILVAVLFIPNVWFELGSSLLKAVNWVQQIAAINTLYNLFKFVLVVAMCYWMVSTDSLIITMLLFFALSYVPVGWLINQYFNKSQPLMTKAEGHSYRSMIRESFPMLLSSSGTMLITYTDFIMLGMYSTAFDIGIYSICTKLAQVTVFILYSVNTVSAPGFARLYQEGAMEQLKTIVKKSTRLILLLSLPVFIIYLVWGDPILTSFGKEYAIGYIALLFLVTGKFISAACGSVGYFLNMTDNRVVYRNIILAGALLNIIMNYLLIPQYGINGAAFSTMVTIIFNNIIPLVYIKIKFGFWTI